MMYFILFIRIFLFAFFYQEGQAETRARLKADIEVGVKPGGQLG